MNLVALTTVSSNPDNNTTKNDDFVDFVPIQNNSNDFDLQDILKTIEQAENMTESVTNNDNTVALPNALNTPLMPPVQSETAQTPPTQLVQNVIIKATNFSLSRPE